VLRRNSTRSEKGNGVIDEGLHVCCLFIVVFSLEKRWQWRPQFPSKYSRQISIVFHWEKFFIAFRLEIFLGYAQCKKVSVSRSWFVDFVFVCRWL